MMFSLSCPFHSNKARNFLLLNYSLSSKEIFTFMKLGLNKVSFLLESEHSDNAYVFVMQDNVWFKFLYLKCKKNTELDIILTDVLFFYINFLYIIFASKGGLVYFFNTIIFPNIHGLFWNDTFIVQSFSDIIIQVFLKVNLLLYDVPSKMTVFYQKKTSDHWSK